MSFSSLVIPTPTVRELSVALRKTPLNQRYKGNTDRPRVISRRNRWVRNFQPGLRFGTTMCQAGLGPFPQNLSLKLSEDGEQAGHRATGRRGQVQCLGQGNETDTQMFQFL